MPAKKLTHFDATGRAIMVDVAAKSETHRTARAVGHVVMLAATLKQITQGSAKKGDVLGVARIAAIQAAKRTSELIPLCHPLALTKVTVDFELDPQRCAVECTATVETVGRTGVEMEALTAVSMGLLTIYDMCKAVDREMRIESIRLVEKRGGRSGRWISHQSSSA
jgi:cyclic pyranopterin phosphate synthase